MAESLTMGDDLGRALLAWLKTLEDEAAMRAIAPDLLAALRRAGAL